MAGNVLQVVGAASITVGCALIWVPLAFLVGGVLTILLGVAAKREDV